MFPHPILEVLENQMLQNATDPRYTDAHRADAAYEYAIIVLNAHQPTDTRIDNALRLLEYSARNGKHEAQAFVGRLCQVFGKPLAASQAEEREWLLKASRSGSITAQRRLRDLDKEGFTATMHDIRSSGRVSCTVHDYLLAENGQQTHAPHIANDVHWSAITGNTDHLKKLSSIFPPNWFEWKNILGETPLIEACREGHTGVAEFLLECGAKASQETAQGVTALHFLAAFNDDDIPGIASLLLKHGADIEKVCEKDFNYLRHYDSPFGMCAGTPLLWAVSTGNECAVRALLAHGADPFASDQCHQALSRFTLRNSPLTEALLFHECNLVEIMVGSSDGSDLRKCFATWCASTPDQSHEVLFRAMDCHSGARFYEYILHGREYELNALSCFKLLIDAGMDVVRLTRYPAHGKRKDNNHPILAACVSGNIGILGYVWQYKNGILRPTPELLVHALAAMVHSGSQAGFDFLIDHRGDIKEDVDSDIKAVIKVLSLTHHTYFTIGILRLIQRPGFLLPPDEAQLILFCAIMGEHFEVARHMLDTQNVSLTKRWDGQTLLCGFIAMSYDFPNMESKIDFVLSHAVNRDILFWNVGYSEGASMTALQSAALMPAKKPPASPYVFEMLLENFSEAGYLNAQIYCDTDRAGYTALHIAVSCGYFDAVTSLLEQPGIETNIQSRQGKTPLDICVDRLLYFEKLEEKIAKGNSAEEVVSTANKAILDQLLRAENPGRISKYSILLLRKTEDEFTLVDAIKGTLYGLRLQGTSSLISQRSSTKWRS